MIIVGCGKSKNSGNSPEAVTPSIPEISPTEPTPLPDNSSGVVINEISPLESEIIIPSSKSYAPSIFNRGNYYAHKDGALVLPDQIEVVSGRAGNHILVIKIKRAAEDSLPKDLHCIYYGQESNTTRDFLVSAKPYLFDFCISSSSTFTPAQRPFLRSTSANVLDSSQRELISISLQREDLVQVEVNNGNRKKSESEPNVTTGVISRIKIIH